MDQNRQQNRTAKLPQNEGGTRREGLLHVKQSLASVILPFVTFPALSCHAAIARPSPTLAITSRANALKASGVDVIALAAGEPDFNTPEPIIAAAKSALDEGFTKYTPSSGIPALKQAVVAKMARENGLEVTPDMVVACCGAKHAVFNAFWVTISPGDEVIVIAPYWMTYRDQIQLCGGVVKVVHARPEDGYIPEIEAIADAITSKTRAILINSPSNPTGAVLPESILRGIAALAEKHNLWIISDEIYERLTYGEKALSPATFSPEIAGRTITISGCSKTYSMTGWRIGYMVAPKPIATAVSNFQDQVTSNPTSFVQKGAIAALNLDGEAIEGMRAEFHARRDLFAAELAKVPGVKFPMPGGAFYFFADFSPYFGGDDARLAEYLLDEAHVAVIPGSVFEGPGCVRLSYTASRENLIRGAERISQALSKTSS
jgi:aspartate aminotransferase